MTIKRKPTKTDVNTVDKFISEATVEKSGKPANPKITKHAKIKEKDIATQDKVKIDNKETAKQKHPKNESTAEVKIEEMIGRRSLFADNFKRETFYVHKDLVKAIKKMAAKGKKGEKTKIINRALQMFFAAEETAK
ncbi:MAG: hypothetical protein H6Q65_2530 [Firmicutes bacterium]|nr:hypothetical protein [Bacillota bacterium]